MPARAWAESDERGCFDVGFSEDGSMVVGCMEDSCIRILDCRQVPSHVGSSAVRVREVPFFISLESTQGGGRQRCIATLRAHSDPVNNHKFLDQHRLLTASGERKLSIAEYLYSKA